MTTLTGKYPGLTYKQLLQVGSSNVGLAAGLLPIQDGAGQASPLSLSLTKGKFQPSVDSTDAFQFLDSAGDIIMSFDSSNRDVSFGQSALASSFAGRTQVRIGGSGNLMAETVIGSGNGLYTGLNYYIASSGDFKRIDTNQACATQYLDGNINFRTAADGVADANISWSTKMTVLEGGNVGIGTATPSTIFQITDNAKYIKFSHGGGEGVIDAESSLWLLASGSLSMLLSTSEVRCYRNFKPSNNDGVSLGISSSGWSDLYLGGQANSVISQIRHTTANTAGNDLTINAGGATSGATDKNGGDTYITSGIATGSGSSNIYFQTATAGAAGTADRTPSTKMVLGGDGTLSTSQIIIDSGLVGTAAKPALAFGDGDTGFYEQSDDTLQVSFGGVHGWWWHGLEFSAAITKGAVIANKTPSSTVPVHYFKDDENTGLGRAAVDQGSLIAGGAEVCRFGYVSAGNRPALYFPEITTPTAIADMGSIYFKADNKMYCQTGDGTEHEIAFV